MPRLKSTPVSEADRAKKRRQNEIKLVRKITILQNLVIPLIPKQPFSRLVREIMQRYEENYRITVTALRAIQEACELYLTFFFEDAYLLTRHRRRVTLERSDMRMVLHVRQWAYK